MKSMPRRRFKLAPFIWQNTFFRARRQNKRQAGTWRNPPFVSLLCRYGRKRSCRQKGHFPRENRSEKKEGKRTKIYEVFMSMNCHSFSLWGPASCSEVWLCVTVAESASLSWWINPATAALLQHTGVQTHTHGYRLKEREGTPYKTFSIKKIIYIIQRTVLCLFGVLCIYFFPICWFLL